MALASVLDLPRPEEVPAPRTHSDEGQRGTVRTTKSANGQSPVVADTSSTDLPNQRAEGNESAGRLSPVIRVAHFVECLRRERGEATVSESAILAALGVRKDFGEGGPRDWVDAACDVGVLVRERGGPTASDASTLRSNPEHPTARAALEIPDRCLRLLHQMLQKMPWVSFKLLRNVLLREQWLGGPPYRLDEVAVDEWVNFLIQDRSILMAKERNLVNPEYPVTALRLNPAHPLASAVILEAGGTARLAPQRAILAVDHFMTRNRKPWMSIGALRRALESLGREDLQAVLLELQEDGALITESYPNPQKEHPTTGCRLGTDHPLVRETLERRDSLVQRTQECAGEPGCWTPLASLDRMLQMSRSGPISPDERLGWYQLLRSEGVLELAPDLPVTEKSLTEIRCRLASDPVTRRALGRAEPRDPPRSERKLREWSRPLPVEV